MRVGAPSLGIAGREVPAFRVLGSCGFLGAVAVATAVSVAEGINVAVELAIVAAAVATFYTLATVTKAITGREMLIYYHHEIAVLTVAGAVAAIAGAPVLRHLDATALGLGTFLALGRVGCQRAGCCYGRPSARGVQYGHEHARSGFPTYLLGVPLVPVQVIEAAVAAALVAAGIAVSGAQPGTAFGLYISGYAVARFGLETLRGDAVRRYWRGLSEAQWTSLAIAVGAAVAAASGTIPDVAPHAAAAAVLLVAAPFVALRSMSGVLDPRHVREIAQTLPPPRQGPVQVVLTSGGFQLSAGVAAEQRHYTVSRQPIRVAGHEARDLARLILWLRHPQASAEIIEGAAGAYHVVIGPAEGPDRGLDEARSVPQPTQTL
jgi:prolipoprotein diacylglyceryltransferase